MRRRIVSILFLFLILIGAFFLYKRFISDDDNTVKYIPNKAALVIKVPIKNFSINNIFTAASYWNQLSNIPVINKVNGQLIDFESLVHENELVRNLIGTSNFYVSAFPTKSEKFGLLYTVKINSNYDTDSLQHVISNLLNQVIEINSRNFNGQIITEYKLKDKREFSHVIIDNYFIGSFTSFLVDDAITQYQNKITLGFQEDLEAGLRDSGEKAEIILIYKNIPKFLKIFSDKRGGESGIDVMEFYSLLSNYQLMLDSNSISGISNKELFSDLSFVKNYQNQKAGKSSLFELLPLSTSVVKQVSVNNISNWVQSLKSDRSKLVSGYSIEEYLEGLNNKYNTDIKKYLTSWCTGNYAQVIIEPHNSNYSEFVFAFFEASDINIAKKQLKELASTTSVVNNLVGETYRGTEIISIEMKGVLPLIYGNIFNKVQSLYYTTNENYIVFGNSVSALKQLLDELDSKIKLIDKISVQEVDMVRSKSNHYLLYANLSNSENIFNAHMNNNWFESYYGAKTELSSLNSFIYSYNYNEGQPKSKFLISFTDKKASSIKVAWKKEFNSELVTKPFLVKSQSSKIYKILVQDVNNNLYCIDESGEILWQKNISGKIMDNVETLDMRSNGQMQFLFNTASTAYLIDDKGANVLNYPIKLPHQTSNELVLVNNMKTKELSFYVYCNNRQIYAYNINGRPLVNWKYRSREVELSRNLQCIEENGLPHLILSYKNGEIEICKSNGDLINKYSHDEKMSVNNIFYKENWDISSWTSTDNLGNIVSLSSNGNVSVIPNPTMTEDHYFNYNDIDNDQNNDLIYLDDGELTAYDQDMIMVLYKKFSLNMSSYLTVNNVLANDKRIGVVSKNSNKIFMFNSDGINFSGFPVEGSSEFSVLDLQNTGYLNLICTSDKNKLINYRIK